jgi:hypothetical protein
MACSSAALPAPEVDAGSPSPSGSDVSPPPLMPSAPSVCGPTTPSTVRPLRRWKRLTAARVRGP